MKYCAHEVRFKTAACMHAHTSAHTCTYITTFADYGNDILTFT